MVRAIGFIELNSIAKGMEVVDTMLKTANVEVMIATPTCPGKYITLIYGDISAVENSVKMGKNVGAEFIVDYLVIPNIDERIFPAITCTSNINDIKAIGVIESFAIASLIVAADVCVKAANVELIEIRLGSGIGGKSYAIMTGDVADVKVALQFGVDSIKNTGNIVNHIIIASPHSDFKKMLM